MGMPTREPTIVLIMIERFPGPNEERTLRAIPPSLALYHHGRGGGHLRRGVCRAAHGRAAAFVYGALGLPGPVGERDRLWPRAVAGVLYRRADGRPGSASGGPVLQRARG